MNRRRALHIVLPLVTVLLGGGVAATLMRSERSAATRPPDPLPPLVRVLRVEPRDVSLSVTTHGTVEPGTETQLIAQVAGEVVEVSPELESGGFFERGDVLARIDPRDHELALVHARAEVARAEAGLAREEVEAKLAREEWSTLGEGEASPLVLREPQLAEARAALASARAAEERAELDLSRTRIKAPYAGRVRSEEIDLGQYLTPGAPVARIYSTERAEVQLPLPDADLAFLDLSLGADRAEGPIVALSATFAGKRHTWQGRITRTGGEIDPTTRMVHLVAEVEAPYAPSPEHPGRPPLAVGLFVDAHIEGRRIEGAFVIPRAAMRTRDQLLVVDDEDRLRFRTVDVLKADEETVVLSGGLEAGERVCLSQLAAPTDGMLVRTVTVEDDASALELGLSTDA